METEVLVAVGHIAGAFVANIVIGIALLMVDAWETERIQKKALEEVSIALGLPVAQLEDPGNLPRVFEWSAKKHSNELFRNRISDICGSIRTGWRWLGAGIEVIIFLTVVWFTVTDDLSNAVFAWFATAAVVFFSLVSILLSTVCRLITGRWPSQAKAAREGISQYINDPLREGAKNNNRWHARDDEDEDDAEALIVLEVKTSCQIGMMSAGYPDDEYERDRFEKYISKALDLAGGIRDDFYHSAAIHFVVSALMKDNQLDRAQELTREIRTDMILEKAEEELDAARA